MWIWGVKYSNYHKLRLTSIGMYIGEYITLHIILFKQLERHTGTD